MGNCCHQGKQRSSTTEPNAIRRRKRRLSWSEEGNGEENINDQYRSDRLKHPEYNLFSDQSDNEDNDNNNNNDNDEEYEEEKPDIVNLNKVKKKKQLTDNEKSDLIEEWKLAVATSDNKKIKNLYLNYGKLMDFNQAVFENGLNCLMTASRQGNYNLCRLLLIMGINIDEQNDHSGNTALHYAIQANKVEIVRLLIKKGCNTNILNKYNVYPKDMANSSHGIDDKIHVLLDNANAKSHTLGLSNNESGNINNYTKEHLRLSGIGSDGNKNKLGNNKENPRPTMVTLHALTDQTQKLPILEGFLEKKKNRAPHNYTTKWVIVAKPYILWSKKEIHIEDGNNEKLRHKFGGFISMYTIQSINRKQFTSGDTCKRRFVIVARDPRKNHQNREYVFRCKTEQTCNDWIDGLNEYVKYLKEMQDLLK